MRSDIDTTTEARLRQWAAGLLPTEAAVELVLRAFGGRFADPAFLWVRLDRDVSWLDPGALREHAVALSGGERRLLFVVAALLDEGPLDVVDVVTGLDRDLLAFVLAALAHAGGSHSATVLEHVDGAVRFSTPGPLVRWPGSGAPCGHLRPPPRTPESEGGTTTSPATRRARWPRPGPAPPRSCCTMPTPGGRASGR